MAEYLTERAKFRCALAIEPLKFSCVEKKNSAVTCGGSKVLTTEAQLKKPAGLHCKFLTATVPPLGTPKPCRLMQTKWLPFDIKNTAGGAHLLTDASKNICGINPAGIIGVVKSGTDGKFIKG